MDEMTDQQTVEQTEGESKVSFSLQWQWINKIIDKRSKHQQILCELLYIRVRKNNDTI